MHAISDCVEKATGYAIITVVAGSPVEDVDDLAKAITQAREVAAIARRLGTRRQALYNRLDRINAVLGHDAPTGHESRTALGLALHAGRLRTGLDPGRPRG